MFNNILNTYVYLLDKKIKNSTFLVLIVAILIVFVGFLIPQGTINYSMANIMNIKNNNISQKNIIILNGKKYKIYFEELD